MAKRYSVGLSRDAATRAFSDPANLKGWSSQSFGRSSELGEGRFGFGTKSNDRVMADLTMPQARRAHEMGLLYDGAGAGSHAGQKHPRQGRHMAGPIVLEIDLTEMRKLERGFIGVATGIKRGHVVISRAINYGLRRLKTQVKRDLREWTGLRVVGKIDAALSQSWATPSFLTGMLKVKSGHTAVTAEYYGAAWSRSNPGATHAAWNRPQIAVHSFMVPGKKPVFKRLGKERLPIAPIWGPNLAREVDRHRDVVQARVDVVAVQVAAEAARLMAMEIRKAGG